MLAMRNVFGLAQPPLVILLVVPLAFTACGMPRPSSDTGSSHAGGNGGGGAHPGRGPSDAGSGTGAGDAGTAAGGDAGTDEASTPPTPPGAGTGGTFTPQHLTITGGGAMPSGGYPASCACDGSSDDTSCLQTAANAAAQQNAPLLIPYTPQGCTVSGTIDVSTSVIGTGAGRPLLQMTGDTGNPVHGVYSAHAIVRLVGAGVGSRYWIYNLHLRGSFTTTPQGEFDYGLEVVASNVTIRDNVIEDTYGDSIQLGDEYRSPNLAKNVLIDGNTLSNPYRTNIFPNLVDHVWIGNNVLRRTSAYDAGYVVSNIDFEPDQNPGDSYVEIAYNELTVPAAANGVGGWQHDGDWGVTQPGGNNFVHHNYGTWTTFWVPPGASGTNTWGPFAVSDNVPGKAPPP
jgi:hypothetical protein